MIFRMNALYSVADSCITTLCIFEDNCAKIDRKDQCLLFLKLNWNPSRFAGCTKGLSSKKDLAK